LTLSNCTLTANSCEYSGYDSLHLGGEGGAIFNDGGTVTMDSSTLTGNVAKGRIALGGAIFNSSGKVTISNSILSGNCACWNGDSAADGFFAEGGGIYNNGTVMVENYSSITGNGAADFGPDVYNLGPLYLDGTSTIGVLDGSSAIGVSPVLSINPWSSTAHQLVLSWSTNYTGYTLQSSTGLGSTNWTNCASPTVSGAYYLATNSMSAGSQFFRLKR